MGFMMPKFGIALSNRSQMVFIPVNQTTDPGWTHIRPKTVGDGKSTDILDDKNNVLMSISQNIQYKVTSSKEFFVGWMVNGKVTSRPVHVDKSEYLPS